MQVPWRDSRSVWVGLGPHTQLITWGPDSIGLSAKFGLNKNAEHRKSISTLSPCEDIVVREKTTEWNGFVASDGTDNDDRAMSSLFRHTSVENVDFQTAIVTMNTLTVYTTPIKNCDWWSYTIVHDHGRRCQNYAKEGGTRSQRTMRGGDVPPYWTGVWERVSPHQWKT